MVADTETSALPPHPLAELGRPHRFTSQKASEAAKRRWDAEAAQAEALRNCQAPAQSADPISIADIARARELKRLKRQLDNFDTLIEAETDAKALQMLTNARWKQFETWRILAGMPTPGSFKPVQAREKRNKLADLPDPT